MAGRCLQHGVEYVADEVTLLELVYRGQAQLLDRNSWSSNDFICIYFPISIRRAYLHIPVFVGLGVMERNAKKELQSIDLNDNVD